MHKDELVEKNLKMGDVLHIDAGSTFYMVNSGKGQRLKIICSIDASDNIGFGPYQVDHIMPSLTPSIVLLVISANELRWCNAGLLPWWWRRRRFKAPAVGDRRL